MKLPVTVCTVDDCKQDACCVVVETGTTVRLFASGAAVVCMYHAELYDAEGWAHRVPNTHIDVTSVDNCCGVEEEEEKRVNEMTLGAFQAAMMRLKRKPLPDPAHMLPIFASLELAEEAGEVAGQAKKAWRNDACAITERRRLAMVDELSDVLFAAAVLAESLEVTLEDVARHQIRKLQGQPFTPLPPRKT